MKKLWWAGLVCMGVLIILSFKYQEEVVVHQIAPYKVVVNGAFFKQLSLKTEQHTIDGIEGFDFEWGYQYTLKLEKVKLENPPEDASDTQYSLIKEVDKTRVPLAYNFELKLDGNLYLGPGEQSSTMNFISDSSFVYFDEITVFFMPQHHPVLMQVAKGKKVATGVFKFNENRDLVLVDLN